MGDAIAVPETKGSFEHIYLLFSLTKIERPLPVPVKVLNFLRNLIKQRAIFV
jgi:hypothetical protein